MVKLESCEFDHSISHSPLFGFLRSDRDAGGNDSYDRELESMSVMMTLRSKSPVYKSTGLSKPARIFNFFFQSTAASNTHSTRHLIHQHALTISALASYLQRFSNQIQKCAPPVSTAPSSAPTAGCKYPRLVAMAKASATAAPLQITTFATPRLGGVVVTAPNAPCARRRISGTAIWSGRFWV